MIKFIFKWGFRLLLLAVVAAAVLLLSADSLLRLTIENRIRAQTGMDAEIGRFKLGLAAPTVTIQNLKLFNPAAFGGTPFLDIPEIHVEYDRAAMLRREIHLTLMRFNLGELDLVKNQAGQTNLFALGIPLLAKPVAAGGGAADFTRETGLTFLGIDVLNVSVGTLKFIDLSNPQNNRTQKIGIENLVVPKVKSAADLAGLAVLIELRSGTFFSALAGSGSGFKWGGF